MTARRRAGVGAGGFTLLEVVVAMTILAVALGIAFRVFSGALNNAAVADSVLRATAVAESVLASAGIAGPLQVGDDEGEDGPYRWTRSVSAYEPPGSETALPLPLYEIRVTVAWDAEKAAGKGGAGRRVTLTSLRVSNEKSDEGTSP